MFLKHCKSAFTPRMITKTADFVDFELAKNREIRDLPLHGRNIHVQKYLMCLENCKGRVRIMYLIQIFFSDLGTSMCQWENEKSVIPLRESQNLDSC